MLGLKDAAFNVGTTLLKIGFCSGTIIATLAAMVPAYRGSYLTTDINLQAAVKPLGKYLWVGAFLTAPVAVSCCLMQIKLQIDSMAQIHLFVQVYSIS